MAPAVGKQKANCRLAMGLPCRRQCSSIIPFLQETQLGASHTTRPSILSPTAEGSLQQPSVLHVLWQLLPRGCKLWWHSAFTSLWNCIVTSQFPWWDCVFSWKIQSEELISTQWGIVKMTGRHKSNPVGPQVTIGLSTVCVPSEGKLQRANKHRKQLVCSNQGTYLKEGMFVQWGHGRLSIHGRI